MRPSLTSRTRRAVAVALITAALAAACSSDDADTTASVTGTDDACTLDTTELPAGKIGFRFTNRAGDVSELYVLRANGDVVGEVENVTTGTSRTLTVDLVAGDYRLVCKPGQVGDGIESTFVVTGEGGTAQAAADRSIVFDAVDFTYENLDVSDIVAGETIRFEMTNRGGQAHEFEVLDADGEALGEVASMDVGDSGGATITFAAAGTYTFQCILVDPDTGQMHTELGMLGSFAVAAA